jgi:hypothetical protein
MPQPTAKPIKTDGFRGRLRQDWQRMTPEEREKLRETFSRRCGGRGMPESEPKT